MYLVAMESERRLPRISPGDFSGFEVQLDLEGITLFGKLGNISEEGLCFLGEDDLLGDEIESQVLGSIVWAKGTKRMFFEGTIVWTQTSKIKNVVYYIAGIQFQERLNLTDSMLARSLEIK
ncbi:PilZ domain-containing protein [Leptospira bandrabouensis]|uniref:PilZ domain-containing protein n=2 Tax=Leptospira bandrabouensis TaxID=2484903 RepID=A0A6H3P0Q9_9LEPT|nr:PilZ domain-containing protein [Leptospira bandrabouensis]MCW7456834.1 PilZ domain-containing protein [Leptospira bandrabouensis]MCW7475780.1 PilZ domain-containing protein [Leptospira bandrabouensis]TGN05633.1 PilZ domain-containing protein [Leptospira bandrabouensis]TGN15964.1 PilZ domain-containing protein [Leptospira bandrabouensis]